MGVLILESIRRHFIVFPITIICFLAIGFLINTYVKPEYQAKSTLIANFDISAATISNKYNEILANQMLTKTYEEAIQSLFIANIVKGKLSSSLSPTGLLKKIQVKTDPGALILTIYANENDPNAAVATANAFAESFVSNSTSILNHANVNVLDLATYESSSVPVSPKKTFNLAVCLFIGLFCGGSISLLLDKKTKKLKKKSITEFRLSGSEI
jgi:capsular polysaccharide biosynthesis protein